MERSADNFEMLPQQKEVSLLIRNLKLLEIQNTFIRRDTFCFSSSSFDKVLCIDKLTEHFMLVVILLLTGKNMSFESTHNKTS